MMKKCLALLLALLMCLACGCSLRETSQNLLGKRDESAVSALDHDTQSGEKLSPELQTAREKALSVAEEYRDEYESFFSPGSAGLHLSESETGQLLNRFADLGYAALDSSGIFPLTNPSLVDDFFRLGGELNIYEICTDGGFLCHSFYHSGEESWVIRTRLFWGDGGPYRMQGTVPVIGYSGKYDLRRLEIDGDILTYEYDLPDNPPGTSHDGHVDTLVQLPLE